MQKNWLKNLSIINSRSINWPRVHISIFWQISCHHPLLIPAVTLFRRRKRLKSGSWWKVFGFDNASHCVCCHGCRWLNRFFDWEWFAWNPKDTVWKNFYRKVAIYFVKNSCACKWTICVSIIDSTLGGENVKAARKWLGKVKEKMQSCTLGHEYGISLYLKIMDGNHEECYFCSISLPCSGRAWAQRGFSDSVWWISRP